LIDRRKNDVMPGCRSAGMPERDGSTVARLFGITGRAGRHAVFLATGLFIVLLYHSPFYRLMVWSYHHQYFTYIPFIPFISLFVLYLKRKAVSGEAKFAILPALPLIVCGAVLAFLATPMKSPLPEADRLWLPALSMVLLLHGAFMAVYGAQAYRRGLFPLLFLMFMVPMPTVLSDAVISLLQSGSASVTEGIFTVLGIPAARDGFSFHLPAVSIEVAKQCSGIRSAIALVITMTLAANLYLRNGWPRLILVFSALPVAVMKNGMRIALLTLLGAYYDQSILTHSALHTSGGIPFFIVALATEGVVLAVLSRWDRKLTKTVDGPAAAS
jgi:exosortase